MRKIFILLFTISLLFTQIAYAENRIAVVDLQKIVENSNSVKQLKNEHSKKMQDLEQIIIKARSEISKETNANKVMALEDKYTKEFNTKKEMLQKDYNSRLSNIEQNIKKEIQYEAQREMYDYVFAKSVVLFGGTDITNDIIGKIK